MSTDPVTSSAAVAAAFAFVDSLVLRPPSAAARELGLARPAAQEGAEGGYVDDGSLVAFTSNVSAQHRDDVLDSWLLAQLAADARVDRFSDVDAWYKALVTVLTGIGWVVKSFDFSEFTATGKTVSLDAVALEILGALLSANQVAALKATLDAARALKADDGRMVLFDSSTQAMGRGNFSLGTADETNGTVAFGVGAFRFSTTERQTRFLWFGYDSSDTKIWTAAQVAVLNERVYAGIREKVRQKLGSSRNDFVDGLTLA